MIFTFHHKKRQAWWIILKAIVDSGFIVSDYFPVVSEYKVNPHVRNKQSLDMDLVIICEGDKPFCRPLDSAAFSTDVIRVSVESKLKSLKAISRMTEDRLFLYIMGEALKAGSRCKKLVYKTFSDVLDETMQNISTFIFQNNLDFKSDLQDIELDEGFEAQQQLTLF